MTDPAGPDGAQVPSISVVIPTLNEAQRIEAVLGRAQAVSAGARPQIIVVDGGSTDGTVERIGGRAQVLRSRPNRARQLQIGLRSAASPTVLFCHGDTLLPSDYDRAVEAALADPGAVGGAFTPRYRPSHPWLRVGERIVSLPTPLLMFGDQGLFARRAELEAAGGVPQLPFMEDLALVDALRARGRMVRLPDQVVTSSRRFFERGVLRQLALDLLLLLGYRAGVAPHVLGRWYHSSGRDPKPVT